MSVTEIKQKLQVNEIEEKEIQLPSPEFIKEEKEIQLSSAEKGTIMHLCMQKLDLQKEYNMQEIQKFIDGLEETNIIIKKEKESVALKNIYNYTKSSIWKELKYAKTIEREKPFYIQIPAKEIYNQDIEGEILVQGIIDLYYITQDDKLVLLDYKTDYSKSKQELIDKYKIQMKIYKRALEESLKRKVDKVYIYSLTKWGEIIVL